MNLNLVSTTLLVVQWLLIVGLSLRVISRRSPVGVSVAWLAVMFSVPFIGAAVYLLFGEKRLGRRRKERLRSSARALSQWQAGLRQGDDELVLVGEAGAMPLARMAEQLVGYPVSAGNEYALLRDFEETFDAIVSAIDRAQEKCHLSFYIWHEGGRTLDVVDALVRASGRGVKCRALADAMGSKRFLNGRLARRLREGGVELRATLPTGLLSTLFSRADLRNHRKIAVIDARVAFTGSQNLVDPRFFKQSAGVGEWVDAMVRIEGPAATALDGVFELDWSVETGGPFEPPGMGRSASPGSSSVAVQVVPSGPELRPEAIHQLLLTAIYAARREVVVTTPYFVPDDSILTALVSAALRGVDVTLIVPERNDSILVRFASVAHFDDLLAAGARIALYKRGLLHTKSLTIDRETSIFGSVNFDIRSLWLNSEISLLVYDSGFTGQLCSLQEEYLDGAELLEIDSWRLRPRWRQFTEDTFRLLSPLL